MLIFVSEFIHRKKEAGAAEVFGTTEAYRGKMLPTCVLKPVHGKCFSVVVILCLDKLSCCATGMLFAFKGPTLGVFSDTKQHFRI